MPTSSSDSSASPYRTQRCDALRLSQAGSEVRLAGWISRKRNHGNLLFIDLRDHWGITQCVLENPERSEGVELDALQREQGSLFLEMEKLALESVVSVAGEVRARSGDTVNPHLPTGDAELALSSLEVLSESDPLPMPVNRDADYPEDLRLKYRFLDLRRASMRAKILLRSQVIADLRARMTSEGFTEFQTPILTASSPEGARDFLVPSRLQADKFYALPQAPQQFKQLLMIAGFERYFQIAPCFRDEDARSDRSPGEFYQLDFEMAFASADEIMSTLERVLHGTFSEFASFDVASPNSVSTLPFPRISYADAMLRYGSDKPDLRNPIEICDVSDLFAGSSFAIFANAVASGACVRAIPAPGAASKPRSFFDKLNAWAREQGLQGLGYISYPRLGDGQGPIARNITSELSLSLAERAGLSDGDALFFVCAERKQAQSFSGLVRERLGLACESIATDIFSFCWIVDFPMYERDADSGEIIFSHNPFSMPQGGMLALTEKDPLDIIASQYDIVCNGVELSSGALRNHDYASLQRAFAIAGYDAASLQSRFPGIFSAMRFGVPPHGGAAPGIERIVMLLSGESNIREVTCFPLNQTGQDLLMGAPSFVSREQLKALGLRQLSDDKRKK